MGENVVYVANARLPSERAHPYQIVQMCDAFSQAGGDITLVVPDRNHPNSDRGVREYYDTPLDFEIRRLFCVDFLRWAERLPVPFARAVYYLQMATFVVSALLFQWRHSGEPDVIYSRSLLFTCASSVLLNQPVVHEVHDMPRSKWRTVVIGRCFDRIAGVVSISEGLRSDWAKYTSVDIHVAPDGVQLEKFSEDVNGDVVRREHSLPTDATLVCYAGTLSASRGVDVLTRSMRHLDDEFHLCLVGGNETQQSRLRSLVDPFPENVTTIGHVRPARVPAFLHASDVLAVPNSARNRRVARHSSPLKLFECMAAGRPIVVSDIPAHREIVDESCAYFFQPDDPEALAAAIERATRDQGRSERVEEARTRVETYSWTSRAEGILDRFGRAAASSEHEQGVETQ